MTTMHFIGCMQLSRLPMASLRRLSMAHTRSLSSSIHLSRHFSKDQGSNQQLPHIWPNPTGNPVYSKDQIESVTKTHHDPQSLSDQLALLSIKTIRSGFDFFSGYRFGQLTERKVYRRVLFLETIAGVPGFVAAILRHLHSLRRMERDHGWIHTLLQEAENERMHLLTFVHLYQPSLPLRLAVILSQGIFMNGFFLAYILSPRFCHRLVGYLEEEAVKTYTDVVVAIDDGRLPGFRTTPAPQIAKDYWKLGDSATVRDLFLSVRADEANHRDVNHTFGTLEPSDTNPFVVEEWMKKEKEMEKHSS